MLGITIGGKETKGSWESPPDEVYSGITPLSDTPNKPDTLLFHSKMVFPLALTDKL